MSEEEVMVKTEFPNRITVELTNNCNVCAHFVIEIRYVWTWAI